MKIGVVSNDIQFASNAAFYLSKAFTKLGHEVIHGLAPITISVEPVNDMFLNQEGKTKGKSVYWDGDGCLRQGQPRWNADYTFTTCKHHPSPHSYFLPFAADEDVHKNMGEPDHSIVFVGRLDDHQYPDRKRLVLKLQEKYPDAIITSTEPGFNYSIASSRGKLIFNRTISTSLGCPNMRFFEGMAIGALVSNKMDIEGIVPDEHYIAYETDEEMLEKVEEYLADDKKRKKIAKQARELILDKHTYVHRAKEILKYL